MSKTLDFESDSFLTLLTDALRAGPGSAEWSEAVVKLRSENSAGDGRDEYAMLIAARETLAKGRKYREVRAGPGFTRRLFGRIESDASGTRKAFPLANIIAVLSLVVVVGLIALAAYMFWPDRAGSKSSNNVAAIDLNKALFAVPIATSDFHAADPAWQAIGSLSLEFTASGIKPGAATGAADFVGGGVVLHREIAPSGAISSEATLTPPAKESDAVAQLFLSDDPNFDAQRGTSPHEAVFQIRGGRMNVLSADARLLADVPVPEGNKPIKVRMLSDSTRLIVTVNDQQIFDGKHALDAGKPRQFGIRFLTKGTAIDGAGPAVTNVRVQSPEQLS